MKSQKMHFVASLVLYLLIILGTSALLYFQPQGFDAKTAVVPFVMLLFVSALGTGYWVARGAVKKILRYTGMVAVAVVMTFIGLFVVAGVGWLIATSKVGAIPPSFVFSQNAVDGWSAGENFNARATATKEYNGDEPIERLPVAGKVMLQSRDATQDSCFVSYSYYDYGADGLALQKAREEAVVQGSALVLEKMSDGVSSIETPEGIKHFKVSLYGISGPGSDSVQRGLSLGYVELSSGHIRIEGICPEPESLSGTLEPMRHMSLVK